ncbi:MAG: Brp/Blh family beta-carotene 15,15'-dioxygenase [Ferruginibacter sp.]|nr:Brp/Blh family beta-carotene 15,15'-dioxygenase [Ferruginibacter sp.]
MLRIVLLAVGCLLLFLQQFFPPISINLQFIIFMTGIILLGIPHGAADILVATQSADMENKTFSKFRFLSIYVGRIILFAVIFYFLPLLANFIFIIFAAYHFGETDLYQFKTDTLPGKIFVISYGLVILSVILLHHFEEVKPLFLQFQSGKENITVINWIEANRYKILSVSGILFFTSTFIYFLKNAHLDNNENGYFLIRFAVILFILFNLPMLLGFTFYFVVWHSFLSLNNIVTYLKNKNKFSNYIITRQIAFYSTLAIAGIVLVGMTGFIFLNASATMSYLFLGLAVLTAPHMQIMHEMYYRIRRGLHS